VRAAKALELQAQTCDRFLRAVTGFPPSPRAGEAEVQEMPECFRPAADGRSNGP
jgi:hypothetical protein